MTSPRPRVTIHSPTLLLHDGHRGICQITFFLFCVWCCLWSSLWPIPYPCSFVTRFWFRRDRRRTIQTSQSTLDAILTSFPSSLVGALWQESTYSLRWCKDTFLVLFVVGGIDHHEPCDDNSMWESLWCGGSTKCLISISPLLWN
jgi:hypothetical protein